MDVKSGKEEPERKQGKGPPTPTSDLACCIVTVLKTKPLASLHNDKDNSRYRHIKYIPAAAFRFAENYN